MTTTIKINEITKSDLDGFKLENESYDTTISRILGKLKRNRLQEKLKEGYSKIGKEQMKEFSEWEAVNL